MKKEKNNIHAQNNCTYSREIVQKKGFYRNLMNLTSLKNAAIPAVPRNRFNRVLLKQILRQTIDQKVYCINNFKLVAFWRYHAILEIPWPSEDTLLYQKVITKGGRSGPLGIQIMYILNNNKTCTIKIHTQHYEQWCGCLV